MRKKTTVVLGLIAVPFIGFGSYVALRPDRLHSRARVAWKEGALERVSRWTGAVWVEAEIARLRSHPEEGLDYYKDPWLSEHLILMQNGEWIAYEAICSKRDRRIYDIFIGRASDGKWYFSTYHFCIGMYNLLDQPPDLAGMVKSYSLVEFDGKSDKCLEETWDGVPAG